MLAYKNVNISNHIQVITTGVIVRAEPMEVLRSISIVEKR